MSFIMRLKKVRNQESFNENTIFCVFPLIIIRRKKKANKSLLEKIIQRLLYVEHNSLTVLHISLRNTRYINKKCAQQMD